MSTPPPFLYAIGGTIPSSSSSLPLSHSHDSPSQNIKPSILTLILILSITIIVSTSLCLLLRFLSNRCRHRSHSTPDEHSTAVVSGRLSSFRENRFSSCRVSPEDRSLLDSLPLFTFNSVVAGGRSSNSSLAGGDCAICLSKFEPHDQLRLLPICCHAFHVNCVDTWLLSNQTCPLCRSSIFAFDSDVLRKFLSPSDAGGEQSFRIEIGNVSRRREMSDSGEARRSYSIGSFDYIVEDESEVTVVSSQARGASGGIYVDKEESVSTATAPEQETEQRGQSLAAEVGSGRSWLREYVDRISASLSTRALSFRSSGRYFTGSSRGSENDGAGNWDVEASRAGEEISEIFRWFSGYES